MKKITPLYFYQILEGTVTMTYSNEDGKDLAVGILKNGSSFGEPPLFIDQPNSLSIIAERLYTIKTFESQLL
ncbi:MAG: hypothetical protein B7Y83_04665 [Flavobacteriales bacterium 32-34-25]|nr:MAG: hypothetical protein B7Y83_04665 [Flavobacteriales bacterium 32-34-25]